MTRILPCTRNCATRSKWNAALAKECTLYYENKVSNLKDSNSTRWWREIKDLDGLRGNSCDWWQQMLGNEFSSTDSLCEKFNNFLLDLTSHLLPLQPPDDVATIPVPEEFLVSTHQAFCALRSTLYKGKEVTWP